MQDDILPGEIDCVFCWRTATGEVGDGVRDTSFSGRPVPYRPDARRVVEGLRTTVEGRRCPHRPTGFRLADQGGISRMCSFVAGDVTHPTLVPARNAREFEVLRGAARGAVLAGDAAEWSVAALHAGPREWLAIHIGAQPSVVASFARRVKAPWTLCINEVVAKAPKGRGSRIKGGELRFYDRRGRVLQIIEGDTRFDHAVLPPTAAFEAGVDRAREASIRDLLASTREFKGQLDTDARREAPQMTRPQHRADRGFLAQLFGLEPPKRGRRS